MVTGIFTNLYSVTLETLNTNFRKIKANKDFACIKTVQTRYLYLKNVNDIILVYYCI